MSDDLIQHFRIWVTIHRNNPRTGVDVDFGLIERAADELERLRARVAELEPIEHRAQLLTCNRLRDSAERHVAHEILGEA